MNYIVFDLEWNQPANETEAVTRPIYLAGEIIEIGAVKLNAQFEPIDETRIYVMPKYYTKLHNRVASLTKINNSCLRQNGIPFPQAWEEFRTWCGEDYAFMTWSESDLEAIIENMLIYGMDVSEFPLCYDIQRIFDREIMRDGRRCSLDKAIEILGETGDRAHDALHDARNTVLVCNHLDLDEYLDEYGSQVFAEQPLETVYETPEDAILDTANASFCCPWCGEKITVEGWLPTYGTRFLGMASCEEGDELILYLDLSRSPEGYRAHRVIYEMSDDLWDRYQEKLENTALIPVEQEPAQV